MSQSPLYALPRRASGKAAAAAVLIVAAVAFTSFRSDGGQEKPRGAWRVLAPVTQDNLTVFPVVADRVWDSHGFLTLDEGIRSNQVVVTEAGSAQGLVRPRHPYSGPHLEQIPLWQEHRPRPLPAPDGALVNQLVLVNNSDQPLILLAGEIVTGGKQDRVVAKDRIVAPQSDPIELGVFCVEPHRWTENSPHFKPLNGLMAQPSVRLKALAAKDQQAVWNEVNRSRNIAAEAVPRAQAAAIAATSSLAVAMENPAVQKRVDAVAAPIERSYARLMNELKAQKAVGAVVAVNGELIWVDVFASPALLEKYWPKLIRSYAAEAFTAPTQMGKSQSMPSTNEAQTFLDDMKARRETAESEPGLYRNTELNGADFSAFILTSLLPGSAFDVHLAKMKK